MLLFFLTQFLDSQAACTMRHETEKAAAINVETIQPTSIGLVRFQHYQTAKDITISILQKNVQEVRIFLSVPEYTQFLCMCCACAHLDEVLVLNL